MRVGVDHLDEQHKKLLDIFDGVVSAADMVLGPTVVKSTLRQLIDYTESHCSHEEQFLEDLGYPHTEQHRDEHRQLLEDLHWFERQFLVGRSPALDVDALPYVGAWLAAHIMSSDCRYGAYLDEDDPVCGGLFPCSGQAD